MKSFLRFAIFGSLIKLNEETLSSGGGTDTLETPDFDALESQVEGEVSEDEDDDPEVEAESTSNKVKKIPYPMPKDPETDKTIKLVEWPEDFDEEKHKGLLRSQFAKEEVWLRRTAQKFQDKADKMNKEAEQLEKLGSVEERAKAKKASALKSQFENLLSGMTADQMKAFGLTSEMAEAFGVEVKEETSEESSDSEE